MPRVSQKIKEIEDSDERLAGMAGLIQSAKHRRISTQDRDTAAEGEIAPAVTTEKQAVEIPPAEVSSLDADPAVQVYDTEAMYALPVDRIEVGGINTRVINEDEREFQELIENIRQNGQLTPVLVGAEDDHFRLIAGERRYRAIKSLGLPTILARVVSSKEEDWTTLMLIENVHRKDMDPWEEAAAYEVMIQHGLTLDEIGARVGKGKGHISVLLKLTREPRILAALEERAISSLSLARELNPLLHRDGSEIVSGSIDRAIDYIKRTRPTVPMMRQWVRTELANHTDSSVENRQSETRPRRTPGRGTYLKSEEIRLTEALAKRIPQLSTPEISMLATIYEHHARSLRDLATSIGTVEDHPIDETSE